jgi:hypothetical protein
MKRLEAAARVKKRIEGMGYGGESESEEETIEDSESTEESSSL